MKKIKLKALTFGLISSMILGSISPIFASDSVYSVENQTVSEEGTFETKVYAQIGSEYLVTIPKSLTLSGIDKKGTYIVTVEGDMASEELVKVIPDSFLTLSSPNKESQIGLINQDKIEWTYKDLDINGNGTIVAEDITAGGWSGTFNFNINIEIPQILISNATNKNNETVIVQTNSITGVEKNDLLNALEQSGQIESTEDIKSVINVSTTTDVDKIEIDVSGVAKPGDTIVVVQEKTDEWDYVSTETVDNNNKVTVDITNSNPVSFIETKPDGSIHVHVYEEKVATEATCTTDGVLLMACECDRSYSFAIPASHDIEVVEKKDENGNLINKYYECKNCDYSILNLTKLFAGEELSHDCNDYLVTKYDTTNHWKECSVCGIKQETIEHTLTQIGSTSCVWSNSGARYSCSNCGYLSALFKDQHTLDTTKIVPRSDQHTHYYYCTTCKSDTGHLGPCKNAEGQILGCSGVAGTCALCNYTYNTSHKSLGSNNGKDIYCSGCNTVIFSFANFKVIPLTANSAQIYMTITDWNKNLLGDNILSKISFGSGNSGTYVVTEKSIIQNGSTIDVSAVYTWPYEKRSRLDQSISVYVASWRSSVSSKVDFEAPAIINAEIAYNSKINNYSTKATVTVNCTDNWNLEPNFVQVRLLDANNNALSGWITCKKDNQNIYTQTIDIVTEINETGTLYVQAKDGCGNTSVESITINNLDSKPPIINTNVIIPTAWSKTKDCTFKATDKGSGNLKIAFNNINEYVDMTANGTTYSKEYQFSGDVYGEIIAAIYYTDAIGNTATQFVKIYNLDNTAPTITNYSLDSKTITIEANDLNEELGLEGSGITSYALTWSPAQPQETDWQNSNQIQISGSGIYYLWAKDLVGNVSKPYKIKIIL